MNLSEIRDLFVEISGRADLVQAGAVLTADQLIREASKDLDRRLFGGKAEGTYTVDITAGQILVSIPYCRAIKDVWLFGSTGKTRLSKADSAREMKEYYSEDKNNIPQDTPAVYFPMSARHVPEAAVPADFNQSYAFDHILYDSPAGPLHPTNYQTVTVDTTLLTSWSGKYILVNSSSPVTLLVPASSDVTGIGINYSIKKIGTGSLTIQMQGSDVINDSSADGTIYCSETSRADMNIVFVGNSIWIGSGSNIWTTT